jgi:hypothetical protein
MNSHNAFRNCISRPSSATVEDKFQLRSESSIVMPTERQSRYIGQYRAAEKMIYILELSNVYHTNGEGAV